MRWSIAASSARCACARELVDIEQRQRAAGDLLGAAERIAVERLQQRRGIERGRETDRERDAAGARHEIGEQVVREREALALGDRPHRAARQHLRRRLDVERIAALEREAARPGDAAPSTSPMPAVGRVSGRVTLLRCLAREPKRLRAPVADRRARRRCCTVDAVVAGRPFDVVEVEMHACRGRR